ncbi:2-hydroxy-3-oxopropionate reductase, partial [Enterococcus hirae]
AIARCTELGASAAESPAAVAAEADLVFTSLPHPRDVEQVILGPDGIAEHIRSGAIYCDLSTNSPLTVRKLAAELHKQ